MRVRSNIASLPIVRATSGNDSKVRPCRFEIALVIIILSIAGLVSCIALSIFVLWLYLFVSIFPWPSLGPNVALGPLHSAVASNNAIDLRRRINAGDSVDLPINGNKRWPDGTTPLMIAVCNSSDDMVGMLLERGASPNLRDITGETALHKARSVTLVKLLILRGADVNALTNHGHTPLMTAAIRARMGDRNSVAVLQALLDANANRQIVDKAGRTAAEILRSFPDTEESVLDILEGP
jgi:ankyrin repeat protein